MKTIIKSAILLFAIICIEFTPVITFASGPQGIYAEYKMTSSKVNSLMKTYTFDGNNRTEVNMAIPGMPGNLQNMVMIMITKKDSSGNIYLLNTSSKTYTVINSNAEIDKVKNDSIDIKIIGKEKVDNYNCIHVKITDKTQNVEMEFWNTKDGMDPSFFQDINNLYTGSSTYTNKLKAKGADGFLVRMVNKQMQLDLVKVEKQDMDKSLFSLDGYTKSDAPNLFDSGKMMQDIQKITPEERKAYIDKLKEQYKK